MFFLQDPPENNNVNYFSKQMRAQILVLFLLFVRFFSFSLSLENMQPRCTLHRVLLITWASALLTECSLSLNSTIKKGTKLDCNWLKGKLKCNELPLEICFPILFNRERIKCLRSYKSQTFSDSQYFLLMRIKRYVGQNEIEIVRLLFWYSGYSGDSTFFSLIYASSKDFNNETKATIHYSCIGLNKSPIRKKVAL